MNIKTFEFSPIGENSYVLYDETKECVVIDPGCFYPDEQRDLLNFIVDNELIIKHLLNTHLHFDHVLGLNFIYDQFKVRTEAHQADEFLLQQLPAQLQMFGFGQYAEEIPEVKSYLKENDVVTFGNQKLIVLHVPGHSPGSVVFYCKEGECAFVGDVLFRGSVGRTDLVGGDHQQLIEGIHKKLLTLPYDTVIYSGHGPTTTIGEEIRNNPFLR